MAKFLLLMYPVTEGDEQPSSVTVGTVTVKGDTEDAYEQVSAALFAQFAQAFQADGTGAF